MLGHTLITGGAGFLGSALAHAIIGADMATSLTLLDNCSTGDFRKAPPVNLTPADHEIPVRHRHQCVSHPLNHSYDTIFHFASPASPDVFADQWQEIFSANVLGLQTCMSALRAGGRLVLASSSEIYGQPQGPMSEDEPGRAKTISVRGTYDQSKRMMESLLWSFTNSQDSAALGLVCRIFNTYGPNMPDDGRAINTWVRQAEAGVPLSVHQPGTQTRSFCYVDDTVDLILTALSSLVGQGATGCHVYNVGNPEQVNMLDAAAMVCRAHEDATYELRDGRPDDPQWRRPVMDKMWRLLGREWDFVSLEEGIERCV
jgi:dTDP-glucose 4,6-dehydratase